MGSYVALFRGINVGGKNIVKMAALRQMLEKMKLVGVQTYIQSGNALFQSNETENALIARIAQEFNSTFGFDSTVILRTSQKITNILEQLPFSQDEISAAEAASDAECLYVYLLPDAPPKDIIQKLCADYNGMDQLHVGEREIYLLCHQSIRDSKLAQSLQKLKLTATVRNWKTMNKLRALFETMDQIK